MAILIATVAAAVNILTAAYNVTKDAVGLFKRKIRYAKNLKDYQDSLQWKKDSLQRRRAGASRKVERFGTETVRLHNHWGERVDKTDAKLGQYLAKCEQAKSFRKRAQLGELGSVLAKEVERVEADGKLFYDPCYQTRCETRKSFASFVSNQDNDSYSSSSSYSVASRSSCLSRVSSRVEADGKLFYDPCYQTRRETRKSVASFVSNQDTISMSNDSYSSSSSYSVASRSSCLSRVSSRVEAEGKLFYDPCYQTRRETRKSVASFVSNQDTISMSNDSYSSISSYSVASRSSCLSRVSSRSKSSSMGGSELKSRSSNHSCAGCSTSSGVAVTGSPTWSTVATTGGLGYWRHLRVSARYT